MKQYEIRRDEIAQAISESFIEHWNAYAEVDPYTYALDVANATYIIGDYRNRMPQYKFKLRGLESAPGETAVLLGRTQSPEIHHFAVYHEAAEHTLIYGRYDWVVRQHVLTRPLIERWCDHFAVVMYCAWRYGKPAVALIERQGIHERYLQMYYNATECRSLARVTADTIEEIASQLKREFRLDAQPLDELREAIHVSAREALRREDERINALAYHSTR